MGTLENIETENGASVSPLRFKVTVSQAEAELHELLSQAKPYYRSRRLMHLARLGLMVEKGQFTNAGPSPIVAAQPLVIAVEKGHPTPAAPDVTKPSPATERPIHYAMISENASDAIGNLLGSLDMNGF